MMKLIYKRNTINDAMGDSIKVYSVINKDTNDTLGYFEKNEHFGWIFFISVHKDWFGGYETLKEAKEWLEGFSGNEQIINKIINK